MGHIIADPKRLWPEGIVPYELDPAFLRIGETDDPAEGVPAELIMRAIREWNERTILRLVPRSGQTDYIAFEPTEHVSQSECAGRNGGLQRILLNLRRARELCQPHGGSALGVVVHELGHAIGLLHEHLRRDRDEHIAIQWDNVAPERSCSFCIGLEEPCCKECTLREGRSVGAYDYDSVMHYFANQGAIDEARPTLVPVAARAAEGPQSGTRKLGRCDGLSAGDIATIQAVYGPQPR